MKYWKQVITVTRWEFSRFFKPKNEVIGIVIMLVVSSVFYFGGKFAFSDTDKKLEISVINDIDFMLTEILKDDYIINRIPAQQKSKFFERYKKRKRRSFIRNRWSNIYLITHIRTPGPLRN